MYFNDVCYPPLLREIAEAPKQLFCKGLPLNPSDHYFAIVGTRRPSIYGRGIAQEFSRAIAQNGFTIVSGLAYGIDAIAHEAAIEAGGKTIAVIGGGLSTGVPPSNRELAVKIEKNGTIITEYPEGTVPHKGMFPRRNRIIAGMSSATLVVEAPEKSGALITARLALEYNRDVFAVPGNITQETSVGANRLIRDNKAFPVTCVEDIFDYINISQPTPSTGEGRRRRLPMLTENEKKIYSALNKTPRLMDSLARETDLSTSQVSASLMLLELKGLTNIIGSYAFKK